MRQAMRPASKISDVSIEEISHTVNPPIFPIDFSLSFLAQQWSYRKCVSARQSLTFTRKSRAYLRESERIGMSTVLNQYWSSGSFLS